MRWAHTVTLMLFIAALGGCASAFDKPSPNADFGAAPVRYEQSIPEALSLALKDPDSAKYKFLPPVKGYQNNGLVYGGRVTWMGYMVLALVNAKNSMGGYTGYESYTFYFAGERVVSWHKGSPNTVLTHVVESSMPPTASAQSSTSTITPAVNTQPVPAMSKAQWQQQQLDKLGAETGISYDEYQRRYKQIMGQ